MGGARLQPIVVAEDNEDDLCLIRHYLRISGVQNPLSTVANGEELVGALLPHCDPATTVGRPGLIFLDLEMPKLDGFEALEWIRAQPALQDLPVVALSGPIEPRDVQRATKLGIAQFVTKYPRPHVLAEIVASFCGW